MWECQLVSADNGYIIRRHLGGFVPVHYFASDDSDPIPTERHVFAYPTITAAMSSVAGEWTEYGITVHPECFDGELNAYEKHERESVGNPE